MLRAFTIFSTFSTLSRAVTNFPTLDVSKLDGVIGSVFNGQEDAANTGTSVGSAGDVNGDGFSDVIIGAPFAAPGGRANAGSSFVVFGMPTGLNAALDFSTLTGTNGFRINGVSAGDYSGFSVSSADFNGDGLSDLLIGAYRAAPGGRPNAGSVFVVFGTRAGFPATLELSTINGVNGFRMNGVLSNDYTGYSVASAGDFNKDGFIDLIMGAPFASPPGRSFIGSSFLVYGTNKSIGATLELSALNGTNGVRFNGVTNSDRSGGNVGSAGNFNGDGFSDLIIGASEASPGGKSSAGISYVVFGTNKSIPATFELSTLNGTNGFSMNGTSINDNNGISVASGDINDDGLSDLFIGASDASPGGRTNAGSVFVVYGTRTNFNASWELSALNGTNGCRMNGMAAVDSTGASVSNAGDINGDGVIDLLIGAPLASPLGLTRAGSSFVVFGTRTGLPATLELSTINGINGFRINGGVTAYDTSGFSVTGLGDFNGDGLGDIAIGAPKASPGNSVNGGSTYLVYGDSIQLPYNYLSISEGGSHTLTASDLNVTVSRNPEYTQYDITVLQHGHFEDEILPGIAVTHFSGQDIVSGRINFIHDDSELAPSYLVTASHTLAAATAYPVNVTFIHQLPAVVNNSLIINQGQTIRLDNTMLAAVDPGNPQHNPEIIFTILGSSNGFFSTFSFSQSQLLNGGVYFTQDNTISSPQYTVSISRGEVTIGPNVPTIDFDTTPVLNQNRFDLCQGQTKFVTSNMLSAVYPGTNSSDTLIFSITNLQYGRFQRTNAPGVEILNFSQADVKNGSSIQFVQDRSPNPPSFMFVIRGKRITTLSYFAGVYFIREPILTINTLTVNQGQTIVLTNNMLNAVNPNTLTEDLIFTVSNVQQGVFIKVNTTQPITQFNASQLTAGQIAFQANNTADKPSYSMSVGNRCSQTQPSASNINFNSVPVISVNQLTISDGQPVILKSTALRADDLEGPLPNLVFTISGLQGGQFETITLPGTNITVFSQQMVFNGAIRFVPDNSVLPRYNVTVSDGVLSSEPKEALVTIKNTPPVTVINTPVANNTVMNAVIGSVVSGVLAFAFCGSRYFLEKRLNGKLSNFVNWSSTVETEDKKWKSNTFEPIVRHVFDNFKTTNCAGYRNADNTKGYIKGIQLILTSMTNLVNFEPMTVIDRLRFKDLFVKKIKDRLGKPLSLCSPEFTPTELQESAVVIAKKVDEALQASQDTALRPRKPTLFEGFVGGIKSVGGHRDSAAVELTRREGKTSSDAPQVRESQSSKLMELDQKFTAFTESAEARLQKLEACLLQFGENKSAPGQAFTELPEVVNVKPPKPRLVSSGGRNT